MLIHRGGSLPGSLALRFHPTILKDLTIRQPVILVTGTNGKTSTANLIADLFMQAGKKVISNRKGDNMLAGMTTSILAKTHLNGQLEGDVIVLEVDELNMRHIVKQLPVSTIVVTNFFRDQLDRAKEMEQLIQSIEKSLNDYEGNLILNGQDPNVWRLAKSCQKAKVFSFGVSLQGQGFKSEAAEGKFCPVCDHALAYDFYQYSHIGQFHCTHCDFKTPANIDAFVQKVDGQNFVIDGQTLHMPFHGLYSVYNCAALYAVSQLYDLTKQVQTTLDQAKSPAGRNQHFDLQGREVVLNLMKNPTGANEVIKVIEQDTRKKTLFLLLNDREQDGTDVSWIYDAQFERLNHANISSIYCTGLRAGDMALRMWYGGYEGPIQLVNQLSDALNQSDGLTYIITTYTAILPTAAWLERMAS